MPQRLSLAGFLAKARSALQTPASSRTRPLTFVVGNESADLDSLCSALVFAYLRTNSVNHDLHIPLSNLPRPDLVLRTEMVAVLKHAGLGLNDLITLSDLPELQPQDTRWLLVDHNTLTGPLKKFSSQVVGCLDHHIDEGAVPPSAEPRVIQTCGSAMSLVVNESKEAWEDLENQETAEGDDATTENNRLTKLALAPILIDTINMTAEHKVRQQDRQAVAFLKSKIQEKGFDSQKFWEEIQAVKEDISKLSFHDIFRKDYKEWTDGGIKIGISCVIQNFDYLLKQAKSPTQFLDEYSKWAAERELDVAAIMTTSHPDGEFQRHLLVSACNDKGRAAVGEFVNMSDKLELKGWRDGKLDNGEERLVWQQHDLNSSRKQVGPLLREAMKKSASRGKI